MNKQTKAILIIVAVLVLLFFLFRKKIAATTTTYVDELLEYGMRNNDNVKRLQTKLNDLMNQALTANINYSGTVDGVTYWIKTELPVTGNFLERTQATLLALTGKMTVYSSEIDSLKLAFPA